MSGNTSGLFPELTPPPRGLQALRWRLDEEPARRHRRVRRHVLATSLASTAVACVVVLLLAMPVPGTVSSVAGLRIDADLNPALIRLGVVEPAAEPVTVPRDNRTSVAVERVDVDNPKIVYYRVSVLPES